METTVEVSPTKILMFGAIEDYLRIFSKEEQQKAKETLLLLTKEQNLFYKEEEQEKSNDKKFYKNMTKVMKNLHNVQQNSPKKYKDIENKILLKKYTNNANLLTLYIFKNGIINNLAFNNVIVFGTITIIEALCAININKNGKNISILEEYCLSAAPSKILNHIKLLIENKITIQYLLKLDTQKTSLLFRLCQTLKLSHVDNIIMTLFNTKNEPLFISFFQELSKELKYKRVVENREYLKSNILIKRSTQALNTSETNMEQISKKLKIEPDVTEHIEDNNEKDESNVDDWIKGVTF